MQSLVQAWHGGGFHAVRLLLIAVLQAVSDADGVALGGAAVFIPLLERCGATAGLQVARFPQEKLPPMKLQLQVPATGCLPPILSCPFTCCTCLAGLS